MQHLALRTVSRSFCLVALPDIFPSARECRFSLSQTLETTNSELRIAYTALPLLLNALDVKLSASTSQVATRKRRLRYYAEIMQLYRDRYDGTDGVAVFIQQALRFADSPNFSLLVFQQKGMHQLRLYVFRLHVPVF